MLTDSLIKRFWANVEKTDGCWRWRGYKNPGGYGWGLRIDKKQVKAHRLSWMIHNGPIPDGLCVLHRCDNPECTNPDHLFIGTYKDNVNDMMSKRRGKSQFLNGEKHKNARINQDIAEMMRKMYASGKYSMTAIGYFFGVHKGTVRYAIREIGWRKE